MANAANVSTGKPLVRGAIYRGATSTTLPTTADATIPTGMTPLGYISEDGVTNSNSMSSQNIKAWGGDVVDSAETEKTDTFKFVMLETANPDAAKAVYGDSNVTGTALSSGITIKANAKEQEYKSWIIDMILKGTILKRIVIPRAKVTAVEDIVYKDDAATGYGITITAAPDANGNTHYEYLKNKSAS